MAARPTWKGYLRLSLVSCAVGLYRATSSKERISFHMLNPKTKNRVQMRPVDPETDKEIARSDLVRGYEFEKGRYVVVDQAEIDELQIESSKTIDLARFVDIDEVDPVYFDDYYYLAPDGKIADETYRVIREAMKRERKAAIGRVVLSAREHPILLAPHDKGILVTTLRSADEVVSDATVFDDIAGGTLDKEMIALGSRLIKQRSGKFDAKALTGDHYQEALHELVERKIRGEKPVAAKLSTPSGGNVINLMDALRRSVDGETGAKAKTATRGKRGASASSTRTPRHKAAARPAHRKAS